MFARPRWRVKNLGEYYTSANEISFSPARRFRCPTRRPRLPCRLSAGIGAIALGYITRSIRRRLQHGIITFCVRSGVGLFPALEEILELEFDQRVFGERATGDVCPPHEVQRGAVPAQAEDHPVLTRIRVGPA